MERHWKRLGGEIAFDAGIFRVRTDRYEFLGRATHDFHVIESNTWVNVVAMTPEEQVVLVRQFRHGVQETSLEVPGGIVDDTDADPAAGGARELLEETGYGGTPMELLGAVTSNPAILTNRTYSYLTTDARPLSPPNPDENEHLELVLRPVREIASLLKSGEIHHSLSVCALSMYLLRGHA